MTLHLPQWCVAHHTAEAKKAGVDLGMFYSFILTGAWDFKVEGLDEILSDYRDDA